MFYTRGKPFKQTTHIYPPLGGPKVSTTVGISEYWNSFLTRIVASGIRHSKAQVVAEALARHRNFLEREMEAEKEVRAELKERREARQ